MTSIRTATLIYIAARFRVNSVYSSVHVLNGKHNAIRTKIPGSHIFLRRNKTQLLTKTRAQFGRGEFFTETFLQLKKQAEKVPSNLYFQKGLAKSQKSVPCSN
jgi:hypothetical protein